ncbi:MAG TPA: AraC family transcriptional regulator [Fontimonas sp.]
MSSLVRASAISAVPELIDELGGRPAALLSPLHIPLDIPRRENAFVPLRSVAQLFENCARTLHCPDFGLRVAQRQGLETLGPIAVIIRNAETVLDAFNAVGGFMHLHSPGLKVTLDHKAPDDAMRFVYDIVEPGLPIVSQVNEMSLGTAYRILKLLGGPQANASLVTFPHQRIATREVYTAFFGCPVQFGQPECTLHLPLQVLSQRIDSADPVTKRLATQYLENQALTATAPLASRVQQLVNRLLPTGHCHLRAVAEHLFLHTRTLQRRLAEEGAFFEDILDAQRRELATRYLAESGLYLSQITGLLGYAEQSAFNRSCRRWFGTTPKGYRLQLKERRPKT